MDFRNNMQKVYVTEEQKEKFMEKVNRDVEVRTWSLCLQLAVVAQLCHKVAASAHAALL